MQQAVNLLIAEDELLVLEDLKELLEEAGYTGIYKARNYEQAVQVLNEQSIDIALLDINLGKGDTGIDLAGYINEHVRIPFIYITSYSDRQTLQQLKPTRPSGFLLKPYSKALLLASIEIALSNFSIQHNAAEETKEEEMPEIDPVIDRHIFIKENYRFIKISLKDILWFESNKNYITVKTIDKKYLIRSSLKRLMEQLPADDFVKCYKQFIINVNHAKDFSATSVSIYGHEIPVSRHTQQEVLRRLKQ